MPHYYSNKGEMKDVRIDKARAEGLHPSVTTVLKILASEGITRYRINQAIMAGWMHPRESSETEEAYTKRVYKESEKDAGGARDLGTIVHKWIEWYFKNLQPLDPCPYPIDPRIEEAFKEWALNIKFVRCSEKVFVNKIIGLGCRVDLIALLKNSCKIRKFALIDFKTQRFDKKASTYNEWKYQLAGNSLCAYDSGIDISRWMNVVISTTNPGLIEVVEYSSKEMKIAMKAFKSAFTLFKIEKGL